MFLTREELVALTGFKRPSTQARWLRERGWRFDVRNDGSVILHEAEVKARLCSRSVRKEEQRTEADFDALADLH